MTPAFDRDTLALYVLGALEPEEAAPIEAALAAGDADTTAAVAEARRLSAAVGATAPEAALPEGATDRLLARVRKEGGGAPAASSRGRPEGAAALPPRPRPRWFAPALVTAMFVALAGFSVLNTLTERRIDETVLALADMAGDPDVVAWSLASTAAGGGKVGLVYHQPKTGKMLVVGKALPKPPEGKTYVLWTIAAGGGAPVNRGILRPSIAGGSAVLLPQAPLPEGLDAVAVSLESDPRVTAPTAAEIKALAKGGG